MLGLLVAYAVAQVALGLWIGRRVRGASDFFVAGRALGPGLLATTLLAANIGAGSTVGAAGLGYRDGLSAWWWVGSAAIGSLVMALSVGPRIWAVARQHDLRTVGDYLEHRFDRRVRGLVAALLWLGTLAILAGQLIALAWVLEVVAGVPKAAGCLVGGAVATAYFAAGGLLASAWVNLLQLAVMLAGFVLALALGPAQLGGWGEVVARTSSVHAPHWSLLSSGGSGWMFLPLLAPAFVVSPGLLQKVYGARDGAAVRTGVLLNAAALFAFAFIPPLLGSAARALHPALAHHELALPTLLVNDLPPALGALGLLAVVSAEVSTIDAILFMLSTSLSQDLYRRFLRPGAGEAEMLRVARLAALAGAGLGVALAILLPDVIGALSLFYSVLSVCLFVPVVAGLYAPRAGTREALLAIGSGAATLLAVHAASGGRGFGIVSPSLAALLAAGAACGLGMLLRPAPPRGARERRSHA
ncbi:MAG TPA: sodium:solute symporter family protein [Vicinamibacteria bacterium]|nr:sodium:solute symporter family protein [Vicinamibacteria bacterium]